MATPLKAQARRAMRDVEKAVRIAAKPAVNDGLAILRKGVERRVPLGETGRLRRGVRVDDARDSPKWVGGQVAVEEDHVASVEFGDADQPARPFLRPTADGDGDRAVAAVAKGIGKRL